MFWCSGVKYSAVVVFFARQGGIIAQQNLAICVSGNTSLKISINLPSGWFYQDHRCSLIIKSVVLIKKISDPS